MKKTFITWDLANGEITMRNRYKHNGGGWYIRRHYRRNFAGDRIGEYYTIHQRRQFISK